MARGRERKKPPGRTEGERDGAGSTPINSAVILPAQIQMIWTLPAGDANYSARWRMIKSTFSRHVPEPAERSQSMISRGEKGIWQGRFWAHLIKDQDDYALHDHLIATAPLRAGLTRDGSEWPLCSAYRRRMRSNETSRSSVA